MSDEISDRDLFGDPIAERREGRGRPEHRWTLENSNRVLLMFASDAKPAEAAAAIGVTVPTLRKHYFSELGQRTRAKLRMQATQLGRLNDQAAAGNVAAEKELAKQLASIRIGRISDQMAGRQKKSDRPTPVGKKEAAKVAAKAINGKFAPRQGPSLLEPAGNA